MIHDFVGSILPAVVGVTVVGLSISIMSRWVMYVRSAIEPPPMRSMTTRDGRVLPMKSAEERERERLVAEAMKELDMYDVTAPVVDEDDKES